MIPGVSIEKFDIAPPNGIISNLGRKPQRQPQRRPHVILWIIIIASESRRIQRRRIIIDDEIELVVLEVRLMNGAETIIIVVVTVNAGDDATTISLPNDGDVETGHTITTAATTITTRKWTLHRVDPLENATTNSS